MSSEMQFDKAEFSQASEFSCGACKAPISNEYFAVNQQTFCGNCAAEVSKLISGQGSGIQRFFLAVLLGTGAALLGMALYAAIMIFAQSEWALISIAVGWFVGSAVRRGSDGRGGWCYQLLAAFLTYTAICAAYGIAIWSQAEEYSLEFLIGIVIMAYGIPFMAGFENVIGILIIGFGVWQAWQMNRLVKLEITGPHAIAPRATPASIPPAQPDDGI